MRISLFCLPLFVVVVLMFALRPLARGMGLIDKPGGRKAHVGDVPVIGGLAMLAGAAVGCAAAEGAVEHSSLFLSAASILVLVGAVDDRHDLPPSVRFLAQACAALLMIFAADLVVKDLGNLLGSGVFDLGWFSYIFTTLLVLTAVNAFNLFDGSDGVAGVQGLIALVFIGFSAIMVGAFDHLALVLILAGSVFGFLVFNWPSRRTAQVRAFMGDAGSTMLGFSLAWVSVDLSQGAAKAISPVAVLWVFALPIFDLFSNMIRRLRSGVSPFHPDSEHLHHILKRYGLSSRRVAQVILSAAAILASIGVGAYQLGINDGVMLAMWLSSFVGYYLLFGTNLVIKRRVGVLPAAGDTGAFSLWRQRRRAER